MLEPGNAARMLLPGAQILAAGVFGVQDQAVAGGLLGVHAVRGSIDSLVGAPGRREPRPEVAAAQAHLAVSIMVAVSPQSIHICRWDERGRAIAEVARFPRGAVTVGVDQYRAASRVSLTDQRTGYRLVLTGTGSRLNPHGRGVRAVLRSLSSGA
jgi:hypothetical protein